jgi:hypothetical protein
MGRSACAQRLYNAVVAYKTATTDELAELATDEWNAAEADYFRAGGVREDADLIIDDACEAALVIWITDLKEASS